MSLKHETLYIVFIRIDCDIHDLFCDGNIETLGERTATGIKSSVGLLYIPTICARKGGSEASKVLIGCWIFCLIAVVHVDQSYCVVDRLNVLHVPCVGVHAIEFSLPDTGNTLGELTQQADA